MRDGQSSVMGDESRIAVKPYNMTGGGWALAQEPASWADTGSFHRVHCIHRRYPPAHFGTF